MNKLTTIQDRTGAWQTWLKLLRLEQKYLNYACIVRRYSYDSPGDDEALHWLKRAEDYWDLHYKYQAKKKELEQTLIRK